MKDVILLAIQKQVPLSIKVVEYLYDILKSYDAVIEINDMALKYNIDPLRLAQFLKKDGE